MRVSNEELVAVLTQFNPWWRGEPIADLPKSRREAFRDLRAWMTAPPAPCAVLLSATRQIGKTTLMLHAAHASLRGGVPAPNILYPTVDHPILNGRHRRLAHPRAASRGARVPPARRGPIHRRLGNLGQAPGRLPQGRTHRLRRSAMPLVEADQESGVGRWHTIRLTTLSFLEYLQIKRLQLPELRSLRDLFDWAPADFYPATDRGRDRVGNFHQYLVCGGFPQTAQLDSITQAQRLLREDIIDKVLKRDMTALFGVRRVVDLEHTFRYLCLHDGGLLDMVDLCSNLEVKRPTAQHFIELPEATHLIYRLAPYGYCKDTLRARFKMYLADAAIAPAVMLMGKSILEDATALGGGDRDGRVQAPVLPLLRPKRALLVLVRQA